MILPGGLIGILGGGQLGRMLALEARRMGYRTAVLDPTPNGPAAQVADYHVRARLSEGHAAQELAADADVVTWEWELVPYDVLSRIDPRKLRPKAEVLKVIQDRLTQKRFLAELNLGQAEFSGVCDPRSLEAARTRRFPGFLKPCRSGYDGKGQAFLNFSGELSKAWESMGKVPAVYESLVPFDKEISVILARSEGGDVSFFPVAENVHKNRVLHTTTVPAAISPKVEEAAKRTARSIAEALDYCGVMAVEMFVAKDRVLVNEIAPRVHNSGHYTLGACRTSQFEQHLRAICGQPLGDPGLISHALMVNLLGDLWGDRAPRWEAVLSRPEARLHLYGKAKAAPGRKMGHVLLLGDDTARLKKSAESLLSELKASAVAKA